MELTAGEIVGHAGIWDFGLPKPAGCNACTVSERSGELWQFTKTQAVVFRSESVIHQGL